MIDSLWMLLSIVSACKYCWKTIPDYFKQSTLVFATCVYKMMAVGPTCTDTFVSWLSTPATGTSNHYCTNSHYIDVTMAKQKIIQLKRHVLPE